jgi:F-type H+-transporting ATPase subunit delta
MSESITLARPYASAAFERAKEENTLSTWSAMLAVVNQVIADPQMPVILDNPKLDSSEIAEFVIEICGNELSDEGKNFVRVLSDAGRLNVATHVYEIFEEKRLAAEGVVNVEVISAYDMDDQEKMRISEAMEKRLGRKINITSSVDKDLIGGSIIRAGDSVIDASVKGRLKELGNQLAE